MISLAILDAAGLLPEDREKWLKEFTDKHFKYLLLTTNISQKSWNEKLSKEIVKKTRKETVKKKIKDDIVVEDFHNFFVFTNENNESSGDNSEQKLAQFTKNGEVLLQSSEIRLKDLFCREDGKPDKGMKLATEFIGSVLISGHLVQFHRFPNQQNGFLIPIGMKFLFPFENFQF